jgi:hypothetical protein
MMEAIYSYKTSVDFYQTTLCHITSTRMPLQWILKEKKTYRITCVRFEVFMAMTMQETVFWDLEPSIFG